MTEQTQTPRFPGRQPRPLRGAMDEIKELRAEIERLRADLAGARYSLDWLGSAVDDLTAWTQRLGHSSNDDLAVTVGVAGRVAHQTGLTVMDFKRARTAITGGSHD